MNARNYLLLLAITCLVIGGCSIPSVTINVDQGETPPDEATAPSAQEVTPSTQESPAPEPPASVTGEPTPTNTLVVPPASEATSTSQPPAAAPTQEPAAPSPEPQQTRAAPIPTAMVDPQLAALWDWAMALQNEVAEPLEEMVDDLDALGVGSGTGDIFAICTGVDVVLATLAEVQQGLDQVGPPPVNDPDLQLAYSELDAALDDLEQAFILFQSACQTMNPLAARDALTYLESGALHMENATEALDRWEDGVGL